MATVIDNHVALPLLADMSAPPRCRLRWRTEVETALRGNEQRGALREHPRAILRFSVSPDGAAGRADLQSLLQTVFHAQHGGDPVPTNEHAGKVAVPWAGKGGWAPTVEAEALPGLEAHGWLWRTGDTLFLFDAQERWEARRVTGVAGGFSLETETLGGAAGFDGAAGAQVYPALFGRLRAPVEFDPQSWAESLVELEVEQEGFDGYGLAEAADGPLWARGGDADWIVEEFAQDPSGSGALYVEHAIAFQQSIGAEPGHCRCDTGFWSGTYANPWSGPAVVTFTGTVDDEFLFDGEIFEPGAHPNENGCNGSHAVNFSRVVLAGASFTIAVGDNHGVSVSINGTLRITRL
jgi:hypothetical protein